MKNEINLMEITNEIRLKVMMQYSSSEMQVSRYSTRNFKAMEMYPELLQEIADSDEEFPFKHMDKYKLILKPLSAITDEDAIEIAKFCHSYSLKDNFLLNHEGRDLIKNYLNKQSNVHGYDWLKVFDFLRLYGYDLPQYLLNGKTLHESGLAIYE